VSVDVGLRTVTDAGYGPRKKRGREGPTPRGAEGGDTATCGSPDACSSGKHLSQGFGGLEVHGSGGELNPGSELEIIHKVWSGEVWIAVVGGVKAAVGGS